MCKCCLWCLEKFMRFINRNAYIVCAIKVGDIIGDNDCMLIKSIYFRAQIFVNLPWKLST